MASAEFESLRARLAAPGLTAADVFACAEELGTLAREAVAVGRPVRRVAVGGDVSVDFLQRAMACAIALEGELALFHVEPAGAMAQACLDPASALHAFRPEIAVLVPDWRQAFAAVAPDADASALAQLHDDAMRRHEALWSALEARGCRVVQHLVVPPARGWRGPAERGSPASTARRVAALNLALVERGAGRVVPLELDRLAEWVGTAAWAPERYHHAGRLACDPRFLPDYLPWFRGAWRAVTGRVRKVLVLDLDDTLWGGPIGDLGPEGIALGPDHGARGEAFADWQQYLAQLRQCGVVLAVCSKNDEALAAPGFAHPGASLRRGDFAAVVCSWDDKAAGLQRIARELDVALDAIVFADDNPAECALVRSALPEVATVELGDDPAGFVARLDAGHWFDHPAYTADDLGRAGSYASRAALREAQVRHVDIDAFLRDLAMVGSVTPAGPADLPRLAQMEGKTNQFNLTTRRYTAAQLTTLRGRDDALVLVLRLRDRLADHGIVAMLVAVREDDALRIDHWLMSCRVFARGAEAFLLADLVAHARAMGVAAVVGEYVATPRNGVAADVYRRLGFTAASADGRWWRRDAAAPLDDLASAIAQA
ncbi:HAD-IIIC family phosphatase [Ramlibacter sp.]|uniref:HAD-IIIC family phosphatase n=1 Tax=Ramlibacter sp. TaxID=1917967 RepID=UPI002FC9A397